eukprot:943059-Pelagomonas_calceolata.AAC.1
MRPTGKDSPALADLDMAFLPVEPLPRPALPEAVKAGRISRTSTPALTASCTGPAELGCALQAVLDSTCSYYKIYTFPPQQSNNQPWHPRPLKKLPPRRPPPPRPGPTARRRR